MIIVDDQLSAAVLSERRSFPDDVATTWAFHFRLLRALHDPRGGGQLTQASADGLLPIAAKPPPELLMVLDPRTTTDQAAAFAIADRLNLLTAQLLAAATHHGATVALSDGNVGRSWPALFEDHGIALEVIT